ncbi:MAG: polysulfide reductase NrfD [Acidobacteriota bacterium]
MRETNTKPTTGSEEVIFEDRDLLRSIEDSGVGFRVATGLLLLVLLTGWVIFGRQLIFGLGVTGLNQPVVWGFYIVNFVFFIGISHAGTLISAILRLSKAEWRRPITRMAEVITVVVLAIGGFHPVLDLGRPDRMLNIFTAGRLQSPLLWDVSSISAYFMASTVYLYIPMIPDIAILRDRGVRPRWLYSFLAWGWTGTARQRAVLERAVGILMVLVIPIAVSVHTVISYIFAMTLQPAWHSTIFGPYFVVGAIFSGIAALLVVMIVLRRIFHLERYLKQIHFDYLSRLLLIMSLLWLKFRRTGCVVELQEDAYDPGNSHHFELSGCRHVARAAEYRRTLLGQSASAPALWLLQSQPGGVGDVRWRDRHFHAWFRGLCTVLPVDLDLGNTGGSGAVGARDFRTSAELLARPGSRRCRQR